MPLFFVSFALGEASLVIVGMTSSAPGVWPIIGVMTILNIIWGAIGAYVLHVMPDAKYLGDFDVDDDFGLE